MAVKKTAKRLGKKHRQASTRPHKGKAPKTQPTTGAVDPRKRKVIAAKKAKEAEAKRVTKRSPDFEQKRVITGDEEEKRVRGGRLDAEQQEVRRAAPGRDFRAESQRQAAREREGKGSGGGSAADYDDEG